MCVVYHPTYLEGSTKVEKKEVTKSKTPQNISFTS